MSLKSELTALVAAAPPDAMVPVGWLAGLLNQEEPENPVPRRNDVVDATVSELAARFRKGESTIRTWLKKGELPGAYRLHGKEWRIPTAAIEAMQRAHARKARRSAQAPPRTADITTWRKHLPRGTDAERPMGS